MQTKIKNRTTKNVCGDHYSAWNNVFCLFSPTISLFSKFPTSSLSLTSIWLNLFEESGGQKRCNKVSFFHRGYTWNIYKLYISCTRKGNTFQLNCVFLKWHLSFTTRCVVSYDTLYLLEYLMSQTANRLKIKSTAKITLAFPFPYRFSITVVNC
jgi:hypothetical protein